MLTSARTKGVQADICHSRSSEQGQLFYRSKEEDDMHAPKHSSMRPRPRQRNTRQVADAGFPSRTHDRVLGSLSCRSSGFARANLGCKNRVQRFCDCTRKERRDRVPHLAISRVGGTTFDSAWQVTTNGLCCEHKAIRKTLKSRKFSNTKRAEFLVVIHRIRFRIQCP